MKYGRYAETPYHARSVRLPVHWYYFIADIFCKWDIDSFCLCDADFHFCTFSGQFKRNRGARPLVLPALLLLAVPELFTLQKFEELPELGERSHQLPRLQSIPKVDSYFLFLNLCLSESMILRIILPALLSLFAFSYSSALLNRSEPYAAYHTSVWLISICISQYA